VDSKENYITTGIKAQVSSLPGISAFNASSNIMHRRIFAYIVITTVVISAKGISLPEHGFVDKLE